MKYYDIREQKSLRYLEFLANGYFDFSQSGVTCKTAAKSILANLNELWLEDTGNPHANSDSKIVSHIIFDGEIQLLSKSLNTLSYFTQQPYHLSFSV